MNEDSQQTKEAMDEYIKWIIGDNDELRAKEDMLEAQYHRAKGRNQLRKEQRERAGLD